MQCEMCGKEEWLMKAKIEGAEMNVCEKCAKFGKIVRENKKWQNKESYDHRPTTYKIGLTTKEEKVPEEGIINNYGEIVKKAREKSGLKQEELAKRIAEKESVLHHIESGKHEPSIELARKLEKSLKIKLVITENEEEYDKNRMKGEGLTIGDLIKIK